MDLNNIFVQTVKAQLMHWNNSEMLWLFVRFVEMFCKIMSKIQKENLIKLQMVGGKRIELGYIIRIISLVKVVKMMMEVSRNVLLQIKIHKKIINCSINFITPQYLQMKFKKTNFLKTKIKINSA